MGSFVSLLVGLTLFVLGTGKPQAPAAASEVSTAITALTRQRDLLQKSSEARLQVINELQRMLAVEEGLLKGQRGGLLVSER